MIIPDTDEGTSRIHAAPCRPEIERTAGIARPQPASIRESDLVVSATARITKSYSNSLGSLVALLQTECTTCAIRGADDRVACAGQAH